MKIITLAIALVLAASCKAESKAPIIPAETISTEANVPSAIPEAKTVSYDEVVDAKLDVPVKVTTQSAAKDDKKSSSNKETTEVVQENITTTVKEPKVEPVTAAPVTNEVIKESIGSTPVVKEVVSESNEVPITESKKEVTVAQSEVVVVPVDVHDSWNELLQKYVTSAGKVDYVGLKSSQSKLDAYLTALNKKAPSKSDVSATAKAYWINAYNAFTVKLILDNYPVKSITDLHGGKPWDQKWIKLGGSTYSLNNIEHDILRPTFKDARIHFAVNCAAKSCPKLSNEAFTASNTEALLEKLSGQFVNNSAANTITKDKVEISKIFDWYREDFDNLIGFLNKYAKVKIASNAAVSYRDYDWALNSK